jgi:hypothetical protein
MRNFLKMFCVSALLCAGSVCAQEDGNPFHKGTNAVGVHFETFWFLANGVLVNFDHGAFNNMVSLGGDFGFHKGMDGGIFEGYKVLNYAFRGGFHPFGIPALEKRGFGEKNDVYVLLKMGMLHQFGEITNILGQRVKLETESSFDFSFGIGERFFIGRNFFLSLEIATSGLAAGAGFAF